MTFIDQLAVYAVKHGSTHGVLPSLIIAQGILESGSGTSELAKNANNLFGIKKGTGWTGEVYSKCTGEYDKSGKYFEINADFRKYPSFEGAVIDLCNKYANGIPGEKTNRYAAVINEKDYKRVTQAVYAAGYATDPKYPSKLTSIIEKNNLTKYDKEVIQLVKIYLDAGHGGSDPGAVGNGLKEKDITLTLAKRVEALLRNYQDVQTKMSRTSDTYPSLADRTNDANKWGADFFMSFHVNAGGGTGYEDFVYPGSSKSISYQSIIHAEIIKNIGGLVNRGKKQADYHVLRETKMPSILTECGFIDSSSDAALLKQDEFINGLAQGHVDGLVKAFGLKKKEGTEMAEQKLTEAQEAIRQEAIRLKITDGNDPFRMVNQFYAWAVTIPQAQKIEQLEKRIAELDKKLK
ncbi:N-acetylmuramoyl-L-alanine amidase [Psychrobacillus sp. NPDC096426]|uniref:N-acetylmuramoyl-L-alanine amidase n=1 Tax=Psychrobacillus sp. NPDC096426 TaxID=3364491 RepID=UPI003814C753